MPRTCTIPGCARPLLADGLCTGHNMRRRSGRSLLEPLRRQRTRLSAQDRQQICALYRQGWPIRWMAEDYGIARGAVQRLLDDAGLRNVKRDGQHRFRGQ